MLKSITKYPNTATEVQAFYFYHRTKEAVIQQAALASFAYFFAEPILRYITQQIANNQKACLKYVADDFGQQLKNALQAGQEPKENPVAAAFFKHKEEHPSFFGKKVMREFLIMYGLKKSDDPTLTLDGIGRKLSKIIMKDYLINRMISFALLGVIDVATRPLLESVMAINVIRSISYFASAKADGISGVYSLTSPISLNNIIEFQSHVGSYYFGRLYRLVERLFYWNPFVAPSNQLPPLLNNGEGFEEQTSLIEDTLQSHMNGHLIDVCVFFLGVELTSHLRLMPVNFWRSREVAVDTLKKTVPKTVCRLLTFAGVTYVGSEYAGINTFTAGAAGYLLGQLVFPLVRFL